MTKSMLRKKTEILAPAGNFEKLQTAVQYGAEAVYLAGQRFGLRAAGKNFSDEELTRAAQYAHAKGCKAYVTINATARDQEFEEIKRYGKKLFDDGFDAAIVADPGVFQCLRDAVPELPLHISTQANVSNAAACRFWHQAGATRIVLSRELSLEQIKNIRRAVPDSLELECFVHGAICLAHSGRCLLSAYFNDRSANRGACTQPCRWEYQLQEVGRVDTDPLPLETDLNGTYLMSSKDLCMIEHLPKLLEAGIDSFKIEGRMKGLYYTAVTSKAYRYVRDRYLEDPAAPAEQWPLQELERLVHREYSSGFYFDDPRNEAQIGAAQDYLRPARVLARVIEAVSDKTLAQQGVFGHKMRQMNKLEVTEPVAVFGPQGQAAERLTILDLRDSGGAKIEATPHPGQEYLLFCDKPLDPGSFLRSATAGE